jgi:hypothetical protein
VPAAIPKPRGLLRRRRPDGSFRYSMSDPAHHKEVPLSHDSCLAYAEWNARRTQTTAPPHPLPVTWLLREFALRTRPEDRGERDRLMGEIIDLCDFLQRIGDPPVSELAADQCQTFRDAMARRPVAAETRIRRLRQAWNWARQERLTECACPWTAQTRHSAICTEVAHIVRQFLPPNERDRLDSMDMNAMNLSFAVKDLALQQLQINIRRAALRASRQLMKDGRPDLVAIVATCSLQTFRDATRATLPLHGGSATLLIGHSRVERVASLRVTALGARGPLPHVEGSDPRMQGDIETPDLLP